MSNKTNVHFIRAYLRSAEEETEHLINTTPTGGARNKLCDANIHIKAALENLEHYRELIKNDKK